MQQLPDLERTESMEEISCRKWTLYDRRKEVCSNVKTDTDKFNIAVYR